MKPEEPTSAQRGVATLYRERDGTRRQLMACIAILVANAVLISWLDPALPWPMTLTRPEAWSLLGLNFVPVLLLNALFFVVTRRIVLASWFSVLLLLCLYAVNSVKVRELATPLLPDDFLFLKALAVNYSFFSHYFASTAVQLCWATGILLVTLLLSRERAMGSMFGARRVLSGLFVAVLAFTLIQGRAPWRALYDPGRLQFEPWAPSDSAMRIGLIPNLLLLHWELRSDAAGWPDLETAASAVRASLGDILRNDATPAVDHELPDIILVQSESLFEPGDLENVPARQLRNLAEISTRSESGPLRVPTFAGGTIRTEFEVLTGLPLAAFPHVRYPYLQLDLERVPSIVKVLRKHGYRSLAIHPNGGAFWNRNYAFRALGFDRFEDGAAFADAQRHGWYVADAALTDHIIANLDDEGSPQLILAISIQNHGPYTSHENMHVASGCTGDERGREMLDVYCALARSTDEQFKRLIDHAGARKRPTLVLLYSDHMPPLQSVYDQVKLRSGDQAAEHPVPWLLFDNRATDMRTRELRAWELPLVLLDRAHIAMDDYFGLMRRAHDASRSDELANHVARLAYWNRLGGEMSHIH